MQPLWGKKLPDELLLIINDAAYPAVKREAERAEEFHQKQRLRSPSFEQGGVAADEEMEAAWKAFVRREFSSQESHWENGANRLRFGCEEEAHATHESGRCEMGLAHREGESHKCAVAPA